jgi:nicotinamidase-related amidase
MTSMLGRPGTDEVMLLCLDAVSLAADSDGASAPADVGWSAHAAQLLAHARGHGWSVAHVVSRRPRPGEAPWRPVGGMAPEPSEPVYHREQPSAFSNRDLCAALFGGAGREVVLCGVSVAGSGLATALDAVRRAVRLTIADDAAWLPPGERSGLDGLLQLQRLGMAQSSVRLALTHTLMRPWRRLRVVQGGRA